MNRRMGMEARCSGALSIQRLERSRPRLRRTRALCKFNGGRWGVEVRRSCAAKRRGQHRVGWSWQKSKTAANGKCGEAGRRDLFGGKAENEEWCRSTRNFRAVKHPSRLLPSLSRSDKDHNRRLQRQLQASNRLKGATMLGLGLAISILRLHCELRARHY